MGIGAEGRVRDLGWGELGVEGGEEDPWTCEQLWEVVVVWLVGKLLVLTGIYRA